MARIRTIKPEFWQDERLAAMPRDVRLLFIGLWNISDDHGRLRGNHLFIRAQVFPYDLDVDVEAGLQLLESSGRIRRYVVEDQSYIEVCNFKKHQRISHPAASSLPEAPKPSGETPESSGNPPRSSGETPGGKERKGREGKGKEQGKEGSPPPLELTGEPAEKPKKRSEAEVFWDWAQGERTKATGLVREGEPNAAALRAWFKTAIQELGSEKRLGAAYARFILRPMDDHWPKRGFPFQAFMSDAGWRRYAPPAEEAA